MDEMPDSADKDTEQTIKTAPLLPKTETVETPETIPNDAPTARPNPVAVPEAEDAVAETIDTAELVPAETIEPTPDVVNSVPTKRRHLSKLAIVVLLIVVVNVGLAGASSYLLLHKSSKANGSVSKATIKSSAPVANGSTQKTSDGTAAGTLHYVSKPLKIEFDYPVDWRISSSSDNTSVSLSSSAFRLKTADGKISNATINITMTPASADAYSIAVNDNDVTQADSELLTYKNPTKDQRTQTYLSFANANGATDGSISAVLISGNNNYQKGQTLSAKNFKAVDPHIYLYVDDCASGQCRQALINDYFTLDDWHNDANFQKAKAVFESLRLN